MDAEEQELFRASVSQLITERAGEALDDGLEAMGWRDALIADRCAAVSILFELQGSGNATSSALAQVLATGLDLDPVLAAGIVLPSLGRSHPPGVVADGFLDLRGIGMSPLPGRGMAAVVAEMGERRLTVLVDVESLTLRPITGMDPAFGLIEVTGERVRVDTASMTSARGWANALAAGRLALASELVGASRGMLRLARDHAPERIQFGRPISAFQAVRHRLADGLVAIEAAEATVGAAWDAGSQLDAALAKAIAGRAARIVARNCQQVLAGIGFTTEHPFHRYFRRVLVLDGLLGDARSLTQELGEELLRTRRVPSALPL